MVYILAGLVLFTGFASFSVDYGRVQIAKTQLRQAADSAALAGGAKLGTIQAVQDEAYNFAAANTCDGTAVAIDKTLDVEFGTWDSTAKTFTVLTNAARNNANAVRVTCHRSTSRGNAIPLIFGRVLGQSTCDVNASTTVAVIPPGFGMVGLNYIKLSGNASASYWSSTGTVGGNAGNIASNGNITSTGTSTIAGTVWTTAGATVSGVTATNTRTLPSPLSYPAGDPSPYSRTSNDNNLLGTAYSSGTKNYTLGANKNVSIPGGHYVVNNWSVASTSSVTFTGPATIYYSGTFSMSGQTTTNANLPQNLTIVAYAYNGNPPGALTLSGSTALYATIYAPEADITLSGSGAIYGSILGKSITLSGSSDVYYDLSSTGGTGVLKIVK
jgi:hypothetical protein